MIRISKHAIEQLRGVPQDGNKNLRVFINGFG